MKVRAIKKGFHVTFREPGDEFDLEGKVPHWCERVGGSAKAESKGGKPVKEQTVKELNDTADELGVDVPPGAKKAEIQALIEAHLACEGGATDDAGEPNPGDNEQPEDKLPDA